MENNMEPKSIEELRHYTLDNQMMIGALLRTFSKDQQIEIFKDYELLCERKGLRPNLIKYKKEVQDGNECEIEFESECKDDCIPAQALNAIIDFLEQVDPSTDPEKILFVIKGVLKKAVEDFKQMENNGRNDFKKRR
jgi:hypothetical protein